MFRGGLGLVTKQWVRSSVILLRGDGQSLVCRWLGLVCEVFGPLWHFLSRCSRFLYLEPRSPPPHLFCWAVVSLYFLCSSHIHFYVRFCRYYCWLSSAQFHLQDIQPFEVGLVVWFLSRLMFVGTVTASPVSFEKVVGEFRFVGSVLVTRFHGIFSSVPFLFNLGFRFPCLGLCFREIYVFSPALLMEISFHLPALCIFESWILILYNFSEKKANLNIVKP